MTSSSTVVVITGASSGIGRATALAFAAEGASLVVAARRQAALDEVVVDAEALGAEAISVVTDVSNNDDVKRLAKVAVARFGRIDVWVNAAGVTAYGSIAEVPLSVFRRVLDVNVMGTTYGSRAALRVMTEQGEGVLINISSILGAVQQPYSSAYGMSKAAVRALGVSLRQELALAHVTGVHVTTVLPATADTPIFRHSANYTGREVTALPPVYPPEDVADVIVHAASFPRPEIVVGHIGRAFVWLHSRFPRATEAQLARLTHVTQFSRRYPAENTKGTLYTPAPTDDGAIVGGYDGKRRTAFRRAVAVTIMVGGSALAAVRVARSR
jgi:NAD(P)-dependent dehydrogenase (short-subunit alcohol dehydrogenase family)